MYTIDYQLLHEIFPMPYGLQYAAIHRDRHIMVQAGGSSVQVAEFDVSEFNYTATYTLPALPDGNSSIRGLELFYTATDWYIILATHGTAAHMLHYDGATIHLIDTKYHMVEPPFVPPLTSSKSLVYSAGGDSGPNILVYGTTGATLDLRDTYTDPDEVLHRVVALRTDSTNQYLMGISSVPPGVSTARLSVYKYDGYDFHVLDRKDITLPIAGASNRYMSAGAKHMYWSNNAGVIERVTIDESDNVSYTPLSIPSLGGSHKEYLSADEFENISFKEMIPGSPFSGKLYAISLNTLVDPPVYQLSYESDQSSAIGFGPVGARSGMLVTAIDGSLQLWYSPLIPGELGNVTIDNQYYRVTSPEDTVTFTANTDLPTGFPVGATFQWQRWE